MARSLAEADALIAAARASGATLAVGHTERYNPAVAAALPLVTTPRFIEVHRLGAFPDRSLDIDVVFDLMIHDLDVILSMVRVRGDVDRGGRRAGADPEYDIANARLRFASGCIANVTASRISRDRVRKIRFFQPDAYISIDYAAQEVEGWRLVRRDGERPRHPGRTAAGHARRAAAARARGLRRAVRIAGHRSSTATTAAGRWRSHGDRGQDGERVTVQRLESAVTLTKARRAPRLAKSS